MPISRLPEATARELGSTLAISTPVSVVKELLDNSLDAGATFVDIIISFDTLDRIEVRDNGHGISTDDLDLLGRSGYTSKITTFEDVMSLGGKSLGFRGVALASINAVAEVTLTTKTAKDPVAAMLQLSPGGGVANRRHVSAPVGTTVHVAKLFSRTPVREKVALKDSKKNLITMKELLQAYALARPHVKLHFRVIRGDQTIPWSYTPKPQGDMKDTIVQLFGTELASSCAERSFSVNQESPTVNDRRSSLIFEAYLPHSFADAIRISKRPFFSVDSRPVSTTRGTLKKLYDIFKMHLSRAMSASGLTELAKSPFIRLNIRCEPHSYDPNIEPSKDDVLFRDESYIISKFEEFILSVYPASPTSPETRAEVTLLTQQEKTDHTHSAVPPTQAPSSSMTSQLSSTPTINQEAIRENIRFNRNPTPSDVSDTGGPRLHVDQRVPSSVALPTRFGSSEQSPCTKPAAIPGIPNRPNGEIMVRGGIIRPSEGDITAPTEDIRNSIELMDQPTRPPIPLPLRPYPEQIQPTSSIRTGGAQTLPNLQGQPFVVDMSAQPLPPKAASHQRQQCTSNFKGPSRKPPFKVPGGAYKKPTFGQPSSRGPQQAKVQTTLSRFRTPGHPGHAPGGADEGPRDSMSRPICSQPAGTLARLPKEDPRSYLLGDEQAVGNNPQRKLRRCKTNLLPLEKTPVGFETHRLRLTLKLKTQDLARMIHMVSDVDDYSGEGKIGRGLYDNIDTESLQNLISRATAMVGE
ncbi:hypothetical protein V8F33_008582 [Rhypophila sp. PSN 637]